VGVLVGSWLVGDMLVGITTGLCVPRHC
jgi:hypothetical protein